MLHQHSAVEGFLRDGVAGDWEADLTKNPSAPAGAMVVAVLSLGKGWSSREGESECKEGGDPTTGHVVLL
jgi:hypothetical protein